MNQTKKVRITLPVGANPKGLAVKVVDDRGDCNFCKSPATVFSVGGTPVVVHKGSMCATFDSYFGGNDPRNTMPTYACDETGKLLWSTAPVSKSATTPTPNTPAE